ncbi:SSI family serine proteinase inhibitor [Nocardiopsis alborubida]|uniref:Proteinase inhibitor I16 subtilisin-type inhibitor n=1 Tax=Nocardiopsis alborubida TaxID=146802 RepID=A0A7X6MGR1_9ACTN|nr:SSI family serine proteinase inhibitor [Nocardiopsis alborubida]NKZ01023.1 proteinase inhibitor I16 subtilisin-type inhibitor [Nocardiopsis alborubida]
MNRIVPALAAAPVLALALAAPAHAAEEARPGDNGYILRVHGLTDAETREATLVCAPVAAGTHPRAEEACEAIAEAGSIAGVRGEEQACPFVYDPVVAVAYGTEDYREEFSNECVLTSEKGAVFDF